jgi:hypothetical protein
LYYAWQPAVNLTDQVLPASLILLPYKNALILVVLTPPTFALKSMIRFVDVTKALIVISAKQKTPVLNLGKKEFAVNKFARILI